MNNTNNRHSVNALSAIVISFSNSAFGKWIINNNTKNSSKRLAPLMQSVEGSNYSYFRFWCRSNNAIL